MKDSEILELARKRFATAESYEDEMRKLAREDIEFKLGRMWPESEKAEREKDNRPVQTINKIQQHCKQLVNQQRMSRPGIKVLPANGDAQVDTAKVIEGLIRNIQNISNAESVYDYAFEQAVDGGFGYYRITTEYPQEPSFDQDIYIRPIKNRFCVMFDPAAQLFQKEDARYCFVYVQEDKAEAEKKYPNIQLESMDGRAKGEYQGWWNKDEVRLCEYFYKEREEQLIAQFSDGSVVEIPNRLGDEKVDPADFIDAYSMENGVKFRGERIHHYDAVKWCKMSGAQVLQKKDWAGSFIPIVGVYGDVTHVDGKDYLSGLVRWARDPAMSYNYAWSAFVEQIALAPKAPFIVAAEQVAEYKEWWAEANRKNLAYLPYKPMQGVPPPQRQAPVQASSAILNMLGVASDDLKASTGFHDASLGARGNETSGIAIAERQEQGQVASFHFTDNMSRAIAYTGQILVDLIPHIYDAERIVRILERDDTPKSVMINGIDELGESVNDFSMGRYDVVVESGPGFATERQEAAELLLEIFRAAPDLVNVIGDLMFEKMEFEGAEAVAERFKKLVPPELQEGQQIQPGELPQQAPQIPGMPPNGSGMI